MSQGPKKKRIQKKTILLYVEGDAEKKFFDHLKKSLNACKKPLSITIETVGGDTIKVLREAKKKKQRSCIFGYYSCL